MLDQLYGRPSSSFKRLQVLLVLFFWLTRLRSQSVPPIPYITSLNKRLSKYSPYQIVVATLAMMYAARNAGDILGLQAPEPLARLYSRNYYRATWIVTALDAGFASAMTIRPKFLRDIASVLFAGYYLVYANEADEKLRKYRAVCTVEMLRATWEKTSNPYIRFATRGDRPPVLMKQRILLPRPAGSQYTKPITAWLYFDGTPLELKRATELVFDIPGGGFICMDPTHHEERTLRWTKRTGRPVISLDYGKAPEYPFPFAIDEAYDLYKLLYESKGSIIGMAGTALHVVMTGDSAGANIATAMVIKILETRPRLPLPTALVYAYAALSFHFTSWMPSSDLKVLRQESQSNIAGLLRGKDHLEHKSPLSVVEDVERPKRRRKNSGWSQSLKRVASFSSPGRLIRGDSDGTPSVGQTNGDEGDDEEDVERAEKDKSLSERIVFSGSLSSNELNQKALQEKKDKVGKKVAEENLVRGPLETRLAMTSRTAFFNDRIISPPMCRAMALLYIGPHNAPDLHSDYHISPIFTPANLLAQFPPMYLSCGERDPFVDDTVIFAGKLREAKETRKLEILGRQNKFGESLRMSASSARDPILDEVEEDWVQMKIIEGWSHGYLQMLSLLPEAEHAINMMADWISLAFDKAEEKRDPPKRALTAPISKATPATPERLLKPVLQKAPTSDSDNVEEDVLTFTPKRRSAVNSRAGSPGPGSQSLAATKPKRTTSLSSSDDTSTPRTPDNRFSPPLKASSKPTLVGVLPPLDRRNSPSAPHIIGPHERALRDELESSGIAPQSTSMLGSNSAPGGATPRRLTNPLPRPVPTSVMSDDELLGPPPPARTVRSGSAGSLPTESAPLPANFVDAKDLLTRRRKEAVFGISATSSAVQSDDES